MEILRFLEIFCGNNISGILKNKIAFNEMWTTCFWDLFTSVTDFELMTLLHKLSIC